MAPDRLKVQPQVLQGPLVAVVAVVRAASLLLHSYVCEVHKLVVQLSNLPAVAHIGESRKAQAGQVHLQGEGEQSMEGAAQPREGSICQVKPLLFLQLRLSRIMRSSLVL